MEAVSPTSWSEYNLSPLDAQGLQHTPVATSCNSPSGGGSRIDVQRNIPLRHASTPAAASGRTTAMFDAGTNCTFVVDPFWHSLKPFD